ncbi:integral membrane protein GPR155 [Condylostylus longicornis]|uniref:integral membrane protein GPR155 n=1 Tax=Condylostylus longicornis TaxID=2530218 RepID=UPI00244DB88C|nr:integral membrane protein GPR155 [Condylostylus longicornis]
MEVPTIYDIINSTIVPTTESNDDDDGNPPISMDKFYPALVQCFGIILCGYFAGRLKIISNHETKGLNTFVGTFALPSLIFLSLVELNWKTVNWTFLLSILISKTIVFLIVIFVSLLIARPVNYGRAGLLAIFCTQSNDFAIGFPIVEALYSKIHPEYSSYIYLLAPISLAILNPIGYILMEIQKKIDEKNEQESLPLCPSAQQNNQNSNRFFRNKKILIVFKTVKSIFFNPMLLMTLLGIIGGVIFPDGLPEVFAGVLRVLGNSFSATALFLLGLRIVGQGSSFTGAGFLTPGILILVKLLVLPLVTRQTVNIMQAGGNFSETTELSTFGFLYGTFPAAPGAFVIASQYNIDVDLIARSMVACTFISAPLMFISAKMISLTNLNPSDYMNELDRFAFDISVAGVIGCIWVLLLFSLTKKFRLMPHRITCCLVFSQLLCCIGVILWCKLESVPKWVVYIEFCLFNIGTYSSRLWTALLAISLLFLQCRSLCFVLKMWPYMILFAWGTPAVISGILIAFDNNLTSNTKRNPSFQYGNAQAAIAVFLLVMCFIVTAGCLVLHQRYKKRFEKYLTLSRELSNPESESQNIRSNSTANLIQNEITQNGGIRQRNTNCPSSDDENVTSEISDCGNGNGCCSGSTTTTTVVDIEDLLTNRATSNNKNESNSIDGNDNNGTDLGNRRPAMCSPSFSCPSTSRQNCQNLVQQYEEQKRKGLEPLEYPSDIDEHQTLKHTVLLILLLCSMFVGLAVSIWTLVMEGMSGIYLELSFLDAFLNFGQGLIVSAVFITDANEILSPFIKYWRKIWYGANIVSLPNWSDLSSETKHLCEQFRNHHLENCKKDIAKDKRWRIKIYRKVFYGTDFVDWLLEYGLGRDRIEATHYARHLLDGRVLRHINNVHHFHDQNLLYTFCNRI